MDHHFIESYEDEREVLRKIDELKQQGCSESDMYVVARSNEQLTMIRLRTNVEYHAAETKGMGRLGIFIRGGAVPPVFTEMSDEVKQSVFFYQELLDGKLLLYYKKINEMPSDEDQEIPASYNKLGGMEMSSLQREIYGDEEQITLDSTQYEYFDPGTAEPLQKPQEPKGKKKTK